MSGVAVLGSTGSIGTRALEVIEASQGALRAVALATHRRVDLVAQQAVRHRPRHVVVADESAAREHDWSSLPQTIQLHTGPEALRRIVTHDDVEVVLAAIVGRAGLESTWAALEAGKRVALANKETLVLAGPLAIDLARRSGAELIPVDSEHSAVFQALQAGRREDVKRVVLTASGGPLLRYPLERLPSVSVEEALAHPTWNMGPKITVDSATMMNKALEIIEARWLFGLEPDQIGVVIHPQSVVHSFVEFVDGSVMAQMSPPDMKLPIQYALTYPRRRSGPAERMDWRRAMAWQFEPPDPERFPALELGYEAARAGGTTGAVLNAANEAAVEGFLAGELSLAEIVPACRDVLDHHDFEARPTLARLLELDAWARKEVARWVCA